jgi:hypothetical protein
MSNITIQQFQRVYAAYMADDYLEPIDRNLAVVAALYGKPVEWAESLPTNKLYKYAKRATEIATHNAKPLHALSVWIGCVCYTIRISPKSSTVAQQRVLETCRSEEHGGYVANMHLALSALSEPGKLFGLFPIKETPERRAAKFQKKMPFRRALGYALFFCELPTNLSVAMDLEVQKKAKAVTNSILKRKRKLLSQQ